MDISMQPEAMDIAESWIEEAYRSMRADMQAMYGCSHGMIAEQRVRAAAARISFLLKLDKKGSKKRLKTMESAACILSARFTSFLAMNMSAPACALFRICRILMEKIRKKAE